MIGHGDLVRCATFLPDGRRALAGSQSGILMLWDLDAKDEILADQAKKIRFLMHELGVEGSRSMVDEYVTPVESHRPVPVALSEAVLAGA